MPDYLSKNPNLNQPFLNVPERMAPTRMKPFDIYDDVELRSQTYEATAYHTLQLRLANAGYVFKDGKLADPNAADPVLANIAYDLYKNDMLKIQGYKNTLNQKFRLVNEDSSIDYQQKRMVKQMLLEKEEEPIYIPRQALPIERPVEKPVFTEAYIKKGLGVLESGLQSGIIIDRDTATEFAKSTFGIDYIEDVPEAETVINRYYPPEPTELPEIIKFPKPSVQKLKSMKEVAPYWDKLDEDSKAELLSLSENPEKFKIALDRLEKKFGKKTTVRRIF